MKCKICGNEIRGCPIKAKGIYRLTPSGKFSYGAMTGNCCAECSKMYLSPSRLIGTVMNEIRRI